MEFAVKSSLVRVVLDYIQRPYNYKYRVEEGLAHLDRHFKGFLPDWYKGLGEIDLGQINFESKNDYPQVIIFNAVMESREGWKDVNYELGIGNDEVRRSAGFEIYRVGKSRHWQWHRHRLAEEWRKQLQAIIATNK